MACIWKMGLACDDGQFGRTVDGGGDSGDGGGDLVDGAGGRCALRRLHRRCWLRRCLLAVVTVVDMGNGRNGCGGTCTMFLVHERMVLAGETINNNSCLGKPLSREIANTIRIFIILVVRVGGPCIRTAWCLQ